MNSPATGGLTTSVRCTGPSLGVIAFKRSPEPRSETVRTLRGRRSQWAGFCVRLYIHWLSALSVGPSQGQRQLAQAPSGLRRCSWGLRGPAGTDDGRPISGGGAVPHSGSGLLGSSLIGGLDVARR